MSDPRILSPIGACATIVQFNVVSILCGECTATYLNAYIWNCISFITLNVRRQSQPQSFLMSCRHLPMLHGYLPTCTTWNLQIQCWSLNLVVKAVIKYNVKDDVIMKYEKYMHAFAILPPLTGAIIGLSLGMINAGPLDYCGLMDDCVLKEIDPSVECESKKSSFKKMRFVITLILGLLTMIAFVIIVVSMGLVYCSVRSQALKMRRYSSFQRRNSLNGGEDSKGNYHETMVQASMYVGAYFITYIWPLVLSFFPVKKRFFLLSFLNALFFPLQVSIQLVHFESLYSYNCDRS